MHDGKLLALAHIGAGAAPPTGFGTTPKEFAIALLNKFGLPITDNRVVGLVAFAGIEGGHWHNPARYNPFNTTLSTPGSVSVTPVGVKAYPDWTHGIEATAKTMLQPNMRAMMDALKANASPSDFLQAVTNTQWCPGCDYTPFNPYALYKVHANEQDSGGGGSVGSSSSVNWKAVALVGGLVAVTAGALYYHKHGRLPLVA